AGEALGLSLAELGAGGAESAGWGGMPHAASSARLIASAGSSRGNFVIPLVSAGICANPMPV
ncbi:MAG: hypothetical protein ACHQ7M_11635, partial [Chloroflexota bacterium]